MRPPTSIVDARPAARAVARAGSRLATAVGCPAGQEPQPVPGVSWGATHGAELPYLFDVTYPQFGSIQPGLADRMIDAWARFAATGRAPWPAVARYRADPYDQVFGTDPAKSVNLGTEHQCAFWGTIDG